MPSGRRLIHTAHETGGDPTKLPRRKGARGLLLLACLYGLAISGSAATFRYAGSSNRIYVENGGTATLTDIKAALPNAPLTLVNASTKTWFLAANLVIEDGCVLNLHGGAAGDVNELRLKSNNASDANSYVFIDADWGTLDLNATKVTSWNETVSGPDTEHVTYQRAFIRARSRTTGSVTTESTLNVVNSEISHLGYNFKEGYGLTWQVVSSASGVKVFGTVSGSYIHNCELGVETWKADDVSWTGNEIAFNTLYGFLGSDPAVQAVLATNDIHDNVFGATFRFASSNNRIYVTGPGIATLTDVKAALPSAPLTLVNSSQRVWHLRANLFIENGGKLLLHGSDEDGDVNELRLQSNNTGAAHAFVFMEANWGTIDILGTKIVSWNDAVNGPDTEEEPYGRAFIRVRSKLDPVDGITPRESRMDIRASDIGYLGYQGAETYGLSWKVLGYTGTNDELFDQVNVYGDIIDSRIHHLRFGVYTFGLEGGTWTGNEIDHCSAYGFDPHDDSDNILIENNNVHHNGWHGIIASKRCNHIVIRNNRSWANGKNGIMLHRESDFAIVESNQSYDNADSGLSIFASRGLVVRDNEFIDNGNAGIRLSVGAHENLLENNLIEGSGKYGIYLYQGSDPPNAGDDGRNSNNVFRNNVIRNSENEGLKSTSSDDNEYVDNVFEHNGDSLRFAQGTGNRFRDNVVIGDVTMKHEGTAAFPTTTYVADQPYLKVRVDSHSQVVFFDDTDHLVFDPEEDTLATTSLLDGTYLALGAAQIGTTSTVVTRKLSVIPSQEPVLVNPLVWSLIGSLEKSFSITAPAGTQLATTIGDLAPNSSYRLLANNVQIATLSTDSSGSAAAELVVSGSATVIYSVVP